MLLILKVDYRCIWRENSIKAIKKFVTSSKNCGKSREHRIAKKDTKDQIDQDLEKNSLRRKKLKNVLLKKARTTFTTALKDGEQVQICLNWAQSLINLELDFQIS